METMHLSRDVPSSATRIHEREDGGLSSRASKELRLPKRLREGAIPEPRPPQCKLATATVTHQGLRCGYAKYFPGTHGQPGDMERDLSGSAYRQAPRVRIARRKGGLGVGLSIPGYRVTLAVLHPLQTS